MWRDLARPHKRCPPTNLQARGSPGSFSPTAGWPCDIVYSYVQCPLRRCREVVSFIVKLSNRAIWQVFTSQLVWPVLITFGFCGITFGLGGIRVPRCQKVVTKLPKVTTCDWFFIPKLYKSYTKVLRPNPKVIKSGQNCVPKKLYKSYPTCKHVFAICTFV